MNDEVLTEYCGDCEAAYQRRTGRTAQGAGFDPISIFTLILTILSQMCPKPAADLKAAATERGLGTRVAVRSATRQALREQHPGVLLPYRRFNGDAIAESVLDVAAAKSEEKIQAAQNCCA